MRNKKKKVRPAQERWFTSGPNGRHLILGWITLKIYNCNLMWYERKTTLRDTSFWEIHHRNIFGFVSSLDSLKPVFLRNASRLSARLLQLRFKFNLDLSPAWRCALAIQALWSGSKQESKLQRRETIQSQNTWHQREPKRPRLPKHLIRLHPGHRPTQNALLEDGWEGRYANPYCTPLHPSPCGPCPFRLALSFELFLNFLLATECVFNFEPKHRPIFFLMGKVAARY